MTVATCTVRTATGLCGKPAVYTERSAMTGETLGECAEHAAQPGSLAHTRHLITTNIGAMKVGDTVNVHRYGKVYTATVVKIGQRGAVYAEFTYNNGAKRTVRV